jgi:site-specific recombinase XerD
MPRHNNKSWTVDEWTAADRQAWENALAPGETLEPGGAASHWRASTARTVTRSYGHWLVWLSQAGLFDREGGPAQSTTPENIARYVGELRGKLSSRTVATRISQIYMAVKVMVPDTNWLWLREIWQRLEHRAVPLRDKNARLAETAELLNCGVQAMEEAESCRDQSLFERAVLYRDGLLVALLATRPFRLANLTQIEMGRHLVRRGEEFWLQFEAAETKAYQPIEAPFPDELLPYLEKYVCMYRPLFLRNPKRDPLHTHKLWLSTWGRGLCENMVYRRIMSLTEKRLGRAINPHSFRHAAATSIAFGDPDHVRITKSILGHASLAASEAYYNLAQAFEASRRYYEHIRALRDGGRDGSFDPAAAMNFQGSA